MKTSVRRLAWVIVAMAIGFDVTGVAAPPPSRPRVILVGWDGADWQLHRAALSVREPLRIKLSDRVAVVELVPERRR